MYKKGWDYPLHLGVTEAGEGEDGRMKSAIGEKKNCFVRIVGWRDWASRAWWRGEGPSIR